MTARVAYAAAALGALGLCRLLPEHGLGLFLRLGVATLVVLLPGNMVARSLGLRSTSAALAWTLAVLTAALGIVFVFQTSFGYALLFLLLVGVATLPFARAPRRERSPVRELVLLAGFVLGLLLWRVAPAAPVGDSPFHLARVRKLVELGSLTPWRLDELVHGGLHPGYAFPLWHAFVAAVTELAGVDPALAFKYEGSFLVPIAVLVAYEAGVALFRAQLLGAAAAAAQVALIAFAPGHGGTYPLLVRPSPGARQLLVPAALALAFTHAREPRRATLLSLAAIGLAIGLVHPTYAVFLCIPLAGWFVVRSFVDREDARRIASTLFAVAIPTGAVALALLPLQRDLLSHSTVRHYGAGLVVHGSSYYVAPEAFGRNGAVAVAALVLVPATVFAWRRRWSSYVLGGSLAVLVVTLVPFLFEHLSDAVTLSQSRRAAGFLPYAFAFVGGLGVVAGLIAGFVLPLALVAGVLFQLLWPGDFGYALRHGGPAAATWIAVAGGLCALVAWLVRRPGAAVRERTGLAAAATGLFLLPVTAHGFSHWTAATTGDPDGLTAGLVRAIRRDVPQRGVVFSDIQTSYRIAAFAPVLIVAAPPEHVADTTANDPYRRRREVRAFYRTGDLAIPRRYGAQWLVLALGRRHPQLGQKPVYRDARFALYRLRS